MPLPSFVRRALLRLLAGTVAVMAAVGLAGWLGEQSRFGADADEARAQIEADLRARVAALRIEVDGEVALLAGQGAVVLESAAGEPEAVRRLFDLVRAAARNQAGTPSALTIYGTDGEPVAWEGRPAPLPAGRITGPSALFIAAGAPGLRLVRVEPIPAPPSEGGRRVGTAVAEALLAATPPGASADESRIVDTAVVPVVLHPTGDGPAPAGAFTVTGAGSDPLGYVEVPAGAVAQAHREWRARTLAGVLLVAAIGLVLTVGPLVDWRRGTRDTRRFVLLSGGIAAALAAARLVAWQAFVIAGVDRGPIRSPLGWIVASPLDFLVSALILGGLVLLAVSTLDRWRLAHRPLAYRRRRMAAGRGWMLAHGAGGLAVGALLLGYGRFLRDELPTLPVDVLHFSVHPWDPLRLSAAVGLVVLHLAVLGGAVGLLRAISVAWPTRAGRAQPRWSAAALWALPTVADLAVEVGQRGASGAALPMLLPLACIVWGAWSGGRYRLAIRHGSQAGRLAALFAMLLLPSLVMYPALIDIAARGRHRQIETRYAAQVSDQRRDLQLQLQQALDEIDALPGLGGLVATQAPLSDEPPPTDAAFAVWSRTVLATSRVTSAVELYDRGAALVSRFAFKLPEATVAPTWQESACTWEVFEEVSPFFAEERRLLHAGRGVCEAGPDGTSRVVGSVVVHAMLDYGNLPFVAAQSPYVALLRAPGQAAAERAAHDELELTVYGWSRRPLFMSGADAWPLSEPLFERIYASRAPFWTVISRDGTDWDVYVMNDRGAIYALGYPRLTLLGHLVTVAELIALVALTFVTLLVLATLGGVLASRTPVSGRALLLEVRASFYRKLFVGFVLAVAVPVLALALVTRAYIATLLRADIEREATRLAASASRIVEDLATLATALPVDDSLVVWLSRVVAQDVNLFEGPGLVASSERNLFASGLLSTRTPADVYRAISLEGRSTFVGQERVGGYEYLVVAAPVHIENREAILTVPLTLRQQQIERQIDELDRRVVLAAITFVVLGSLLGYWMAERIADPVNRLMRATRRLASGDLNARVLVTSSDELRRLVEAFNGMADDLQRQRGQLERTNRLEAWAEMARQVAHDIKNPLTPIQLNAEHLRRVHADRGRPLDPVLDECVTAILQQVRLLRQIASEFSSFASSPRAEATPTPLAPLLDEILDPYRTALAGRIAIVSTVQDGLPPAFVDRGLLARAIVNVVENALHAMPGSGTLRVDASRDQAPGTLRLTIADTGVGMDAAALARIFEPYFSTKATGTGLGLTIARRNVELNAGTIAVDSARGVGTTVTLRIPFAPAELPPAAA